MQKTLVFCTVLLISVNVFASLQDLINVMTPTATSPGCISFSAFVDNLNPNWGPSPSEDLISVLLNNLVTQTPYRCIMIYDLSDSYATIVKVSASLNVKVLGHVYLGNSTTANQNSIFGAIVTAKQFPDTLLGISCGSEIAYNNNDPVLTLTIVSDCITQLRNAGVTQPLGYIDVATVWCSGDEYPCTRRYEGMANIVDFIGLDEFPWWENVNSKIFTCEPAENAANQTIFIYNSVKGLYNDKPVLLTEFGWPSSNGANITSQPNKYTGQRCGITNPTISKQVNQQTINLCAQYGIPCNLFEAFDEPWKGNGNPYDVNDFWGICSGTPPYTCTNSPTVATGPIFLTTSVPAPTSTLSSSSNPPLSNTGSPLTQDPIPLSPRQVSDGSLQSYASLFTAVIIILVSVII